MGRKTFFSKKKKEEFPQRGGGHSGRRGTVWNAPNGEGWLQRGGSFAREIPA